MSKITHIGRNFSDTSSGSKKLLELFPGLSSIVSNNSVLRSPLYPQITYLTLVEIPLTFLLSLSLIFLSGKIRQEYLPNIFQLFMCTILVHWMSSRNWLLRLTISVNLYKSLIQVSTNPDR